ncbi:hypothetical protein [Trinickia violacea]|uniref:hypothetical protein n=1 Tax=Trinickia violacea TaxID=2571746 RepID=UPI0020C7D4F2|nr:hypothetical protein [Trinickia violacea]
MTRTSATSLIATFVSTVFIYTTSFAADDLPEGFGEKPNSRFVVSDDPYYKDPLIAIKNGVAAYKKNYRTNHFCVVGYRWLHGNVNVWVLWKEEEELLLWDGALDPESRADSFNGVHRALKLGRDTVKTENEINGSTYLETEQWWHAVAGDCMKHGEKYVIKPFKAAKPRTD